MVDQPTTATSALSPLGDMASALMEGFQGARNPPGLGTYEGNVATPANPFNSGIYGEPAQAPAATPAMPQPQTGVAPPPAPSMPPVNPFTQGARPTPFLNASALFGRPPMSGSPLGMPAQRPNPVGQI